MKTQKQLEAAVDETERKKAEFYIHREWDEWKPTGRGDEEQHCYRDKLGPYESAERAYAVGNEWRAGFGDGARFHVKDGTGCFPKRFTAADGRPTVIRFGPTLPSPEDYSVFTSKVQ